MIIDRIKEEFNSQPNKRYLFIFDPNKEYYKEIQELPEPFQLIIADKNYFNLKTSIASLSAQHIVLYHPFARPQESQLKNFPLIGLLISNIELRLDDTAHFMNQYGLSENKRPLVRKWINHLNKTNCKKLSNILSQSEFTAENLERGFISIAVDLHTVYEKYYIVLQLFSKSKDRDALQKISVNLQSLFLEKVVLKWINEIFDIAIAKIDFDEIERLLQYIKYNVIVYHITIIKNEDTYRQLKAKNINVANRIWSFYQSWSEHPKFKDDITFHFDNTARAIDENKIINLYGIDNEYGYLSIKMLGKIIDKDIFIINEILDTKEYQKLDTIADRTITAASDDEDIKQVKLLILNIINIINLIKSINDAGIYKFTNPSEILKNYEKYGYLSDTYYRNIVYGHDQLSKVWKIKINELYNRIHQVYDEFLIKQNVHYMDQMNRIEFDYDKIDFPKQYNFYADNIHEDKTVVIISDAFRYELAKELESNLLKEKKAKVDVKGAMASIPTYTQMGMTNLLPHETIELVSKDLNFNFSIGGIKTNASNRGRIINAQLGKGTSVQYEEIENMSTQDLATLIKENKLVYIYHNHVDATGDNNELESLTFQSCHKSLGDIENLIKRVSRIPIKDIFVTADHGFLYTHKNVSDADKEDMPSTGNNYYSNSRCYITDKTSNHSTGYTFPLSNTTKLDTELKVLLPKAINKYRRQGNIGLRFVHGGGSLQEMVIPILKYKKGREEVRALVNIRRIDTVSKMTAGSIKVSIFQNEVLSNSVSSRLVLLGLYNDENELISNEVSINLDITDERPSARTFNEILSLNENGTGLSFCKLRAFDYTDNNKLNPLIDDKIIIQTIMDIDEF